MRFEELNRLIPYVTGGKPKVLSMHPYNAITLRMPGRHSNDTIPIGGDFVVCVDDADLDWTEHQFTHEDIFWDVQEKRDYHPELTRQLMVDYKSVIADNAMMIGWLEHLPGVNPTTFLYAVQCLAVAEHRRYARFEPQFGGRYLPIRFAAGIAEGLWDADAAIGMQKKGRPGVEMLEKFNGVPALTATMMA